MSAGRNGESTGCKLCLSVVEGGSSIQITKWVLWKCNQDIGLTLLSFHLSLVYRQVVGFKSPSDFLDGISETCLFRRQNAVFRKGTGSRVDCVSLVCYTSPLPSVFVSIYASLSFSSCLLLSPTTSPSLAPYVFFRGDTHRLSFCLRIYLIIYLPSYLPT